MKNMIDLQRGIDPVDLMPTVFDGYDGGFCVSYRWGGEVGADFFGCVVRMDRDSTLSLDQAVASAREINRAREEEIRWNLANR